MLMCEYHIFYFDRINFRYSILTSPHGTNCSHTAGCSWFINTNNNVVLMYTEKPVYALTGLEMIPQPQCNEVRSSFLYGQNMIRASRLSNVTWSITRDRRTNTVCVLQRMGLYVKNISEEYRYSEYSPNNTVQKNYLFHLYGQFQ